MDIKTSKLFLVFEVVVPAFIAWGIGQGLSQMWEPFLQAAKVATKHDWQTSGIVLAAMLGGLWLLKRHYARVSQNAIIQLIAPGA